MADTKAPTPMDPSAQEGNAPEIYVPLPRLPYAMQQLIEEVTVLFPETLYEVSNRNQRGVAFDVQFDLSALGATAGDLSLVLSLLNDPAYNEDSRIEGVLLDPQESSVLVSFRNDVHTMDDRAPFGIAEAFEVLAGES